MVYFITEKVEIPEPGIADRIMYAVIFGKEKLEVRKDAKNKTDDF